MNLSTREMLRKVPFLGALTDSECDALAGALVTRKVSQGSVLFKQGEQGDFMAILASGRLQVVVQSEEGLKREVATIYPGETVGEMACIDPANRSATVVAQKDATVQLLDRTMLKALQQHAPSVAVAVQGGIITLLTRRIRETNENIERHMSLHGIGLIGDEGNEPARPHRDETQHEGAGTASGRIDLKSVPFLSDFTNEELATLVRVAPPRTYPVHHVLCHEGERGDSCCIIARGSVDVVRRISGQERVLATLKTGAVVGQMALIDRSPRSATVKIKDEAVVLMLHRKTFNQLLEAKSPIAVRFQNQIAVAGIKQLRMANARLSDLFHQVAPQATNLGSIPTHNPKPTGVTPQPKAPTPTPPIEVQDDESDVDLVLSYMQTALSEWDLSLDELDNVEVARPHGSISAAELKARSGQ